MNYKHYNTPYSAKEKLRALRLWKNSTTEFVCHRYHCSERSLWRWKSIYDGTIESLENKSKRPHTPHPNRQTDEEKKHIFDLVRRNPNIGLNELYGKQGVDENGYFTDHAVLSGKVHIAGSVDGKELDDYQAKFVGLTITADEITNLVSVTFEYMPDDAILTVNGEII